MARKGRRWGTLVSGVVLGAVAMWLVGSYHFVRTTQHSLLIPRTSYAWDDIYADIRGWDAQEWQRHPRLVEALMRSGRQDLLPAPPRRKGRPGWYSRWIPPNAQPHPSQPHP